jgi:hypothetical protein
MNEQRQGIRYPLRLPAEVRWTSRGKSAGPIKGEIGDISSSGLLVLIPKHLPVGTTINVTINLPVDLTKVPVRLTCKGRVVRKSSMGKSAGISAIIEDFKLRPSRRKSAKA